MNGPKARQHLPARTRLGYDAPYDDEMMEEAVDLIRAGEEPERRKGKKRGKALGKSGIALDEPFMQNERSSCWFDHGLVQMYIALSSSSSLDSVCQAWSTDDAATDALPHIADFLLKIRDSRGRPDVDAVVKELSQARNDVYDTMVELKKTGTTYIPSENGFNSQFVRFFLIAWY